MESVSLGKILIIDDDTSFLDLLQASLSDTEFDLDVAASAETGLSKLEQGNFDLVLTDINLPNMNGLEFCRLSREKYPQLRVIVMTAFSSIETAVHALRVGAHDYMIKPLNLEALHIRLVRLLTEKRKGGELIRLRGLAEKKEGFGELLGNSPAMQRVYNLISRAAETDASVLITGDSGTGKELIARALHRCGKRKDEAFVPVNCSAIPEQLVESELFGHSKGAFTDARDSRPGLFAQAHNGTLFLDEIGEIPITMQPKLLRALEERSIRPVGSDRELEVNIRLIAATNRDLESRIEEGLFRQDLFFRVNVIHIEVPPLSDRGTDVVMLAQSFLQEYGTRFGKEGIEGFSNDALKKLMAYSWPGNVRELRNCVERSVALSGGSQIEVEDLPDRLRDHKSADLVVPGDNPSELLSMEEVERNYILHVINAVKGNKSMAAQILGVDRKTLYRKLQRYGKAVGNPAIADAP